MTARPTPPAGGSRPKGVGGTPSKRPGRMTAGEGKSWSDDAPAFDLGAAPAPEGLGEAGLALWSEVSGAFELRADEAVLLEQMARTLDDIGQMREAIARDGLVVTGSQGQSRPNGMLAELRGSRLLLLRLAQQLALPDGDDDKAGATPASRKAARAANERWRREAVASGEA